MDLLDRLIFFVIGASIGFVLGYIVAHLREIKKGVGEVLDIEKNKPDSENGPASRDERGEIKRPHHIASVGLFLVLIVTAWAAIATGKVNSELDHTVTCLTQYNSHLGRSLSSRDMAVKAGTQSEIDLWTKYKKLYAIAKSDPKKIPVVQEKLNKAILEHRNDLIETQKIRQMNPYPDPDILKNCKEN